MQRMTKIGQLSSISQLSSQNTDLTTSANLLERTGFMTKSDLHSPAQLPFQVAAEVGCDDTQRGMLQVTLERKMRSKF